MYNRITIMQYTIYIVYLRSSRILLFFNNKFNRFIFNKVIVKSSNLELEYIIYAV